MKVGADLLTLRYAQVALGALWYVTLISDHRLRFKNVLMGSRMRLRRAGISAKTMLVSCMLSETLLLS